MNDLVTVSIITPVYKSSKWLKGYFKALSEVENDFCDLEVVIIDNDPTSLSFEEYYAMSMGLDLKIISNDYNAGFSAACNQGVNKATGEFVLFLNVDTKIAPSTIKQLVDHLQSEPGCALVEAKQTPEEHPKFWWPGSGHVEWCSACCALMRKSLFLEIGGFDERFFLYCEDVDLSFRLTDRGYKLAYVPSAICEHFNSDRKRKADSFSTFHEIKSSIILRARYLGTWNFISSFYQQFIRILARKVPGSFYKSLSAMKEGLKASAGVFVERWSSRHSSDYKVFGDRGEYTLHYRFPQIGSSGSSLSAESLESSESSEFLQTGDLQVGDLQVGDLQDGDLQDGDNGETKCLSVIIPAKNRGFEIDNICHAVLSQLDDLGCGELIVVDYGSSIGSVEGLRERFKNRNNLTVVKSPVNKWAVAIEKGILNSSGSVLLFLSSDLIPHPELLKHHLQLQLHHDMVSNKITRRYPVSGSLFKKYVRDRISLKEQSFFAEASTLMGKDYFAPSNLANFSIKKEIINGKEELLADYSLNLWSGRVAMELLFHRINNEGHTLIMDRNCESLDVSTPSFRTFMARAFKYGFTKSLDSKAPAGLTLSFVRRLLSFLFVVTPLSLPGLFVELLLPPSQKINPLAAWWFVSAEKLFFSAGKLWQHRFREYFQ